ncbi:hypothetical protein DIURU_003999 [Diutina rugosa]|uniref:DNA-directed RNA polymerase n=1 Tax=Diutina rugosa TaxID=5481 RepID=A0A642UJB4_DIURU|nr:uncharacterized protein DIURU_003999 [Diutina rugosa]KAA8900051.1 hypothetical protein DIURU_003999 [Diutina rugosa]
MLSHTTQRAVRTLRTPLRVLATSTAPPSVGGSSAPPVSPFLEDLARRRAPRAPARALDLTETSFRGIDAAAIPQLSAHDREQSWSSSYDPVVRLPYARDVSHLASLLDALIQSKNFARAESILHSLHSLDTPQGFVHHVNSYLAGWSDDEAVTVKMVEQWLASALAKYPGLELSDRTHAIVLAKYVRDKVDFDPFLARFPPHQLKSIFSNIDILGIDDLTVVFASDRITDKHVPEDLRGLIGSATTPATAQSAGGESSSEASSEVPEYFRSDAAKAPSVRKDLDELRDVGSFGIKVIRHTLLGLKQDDAELESLLNAIETGVDGSVLTQGNSVDFFQIYRQLKTPEQRQKFNDALNAYNQHRQQQLELRGLDGAREKWKHAFEDMQRRGTINMSKDINSELFKWYQAMLPSVVHEAQLCRDLMEGKVDMASLSEEEQQQMAHREHYAPYFVLVAPEKLCVITILELIRLNSTGGVADGMRAARALLSVGRSVELEYRSQNYLKAERKHSKKVRSSKQWRKLLSNSTQAQDPQSSSEWSENVLGKLGSVLTSYLISVAKVNVKAKDPATGKVIKASQPVFHHTYQHCGGQRVGVIKIHREVMKRLAGDELSACIQPQLLPMLVPPKPWTSYSGGGFLFTNSQVVRNKDSPETLAYLKAASDQGKLTQVYHGLNVLGDTAWTINKRLFEVVTHYWNTGESFSSIPQVVVEPKLPPKPPVDAEPQTKFEYARDVRDILNEAAGLRSQRCDTNYKLEIARAFIGEKMHFPHNLDFRGRAYPLSPHLNHLGNDLVRSLFLFWDGKQLGEQGLRWLKIHLANVYGFDKAPLDERAQFGDKHLEDIRASARDPLAPDAWWRKAEKPWQALSVCFELAEAYELDDPTTYVSHLPVHQDGTCNGLQHYAALGGDVEGAKQVNLLPADRPQDVYKFVANLVQKRVDADAAAGVDEAVKVQNYVTRKVVKQTVMTNVYGVTFVGAVAQIQKQLMALDFPREEANRLSKYLTQQVFASIRELFEGAHLIQDWLGEVARRITKSIRVDYEDTASEDPAKPNHLSSVIWTTPLGLPCVQPYRVAKNKTIKTNLQDITLADPFGAGQVDSRKQQTAFPPNFVHSLDATHMLLTAKACGDHGLSFAAVHDSYWTHACAVDTMNREIRSQFINLHSADLVAQLREEFCKRYKGFLQVVNLPSDHAVVKQVKQIRKQWAAKAGRPVTVADEVYMERKRQSLLESEDPEVRQVGRSMVTTVSVTEGLHLEDAAVKTVGTKILVPLVFPEIPAKGDFDLNQVAQSSYFFS